MSSKKKNRNRRNSGRRAGQRIRSRRRFALAAFFLPAVFLLIAYIYLGIYPFGDHVEMIIDSYHQYVPFISEFHDKLRSGDSLLYSWHGSLGFSFLAVMAYYLGSPLTFIVFFFPASMMTEAFETLIVLNISLAGLFMFWYLSERSGRSGAPECLFSVFYALSGFMLAYNWNFMWLGSVALFPLIMLGAERLIDRKDARLYIIAFGLAIISNYYICIMIGIFMVIWFFAYWFMKKRGGVRDFLACGLRYLLSTLLAAGLSMFYLLPTVYAMRSSSTGIKPTAWKLYRSFPDVLNQLFAYTKPTQLEGAPNLYCGIVICVLVCLYVFAHGISLREKLIRGGVTAFLLVSLNVNVLDYIWHGLHFPNNLPGRFTFIFVFMMIVMAYDAWRFLPQETPREHFVSAMFAAGLFVLCTAGSDEKIESYSIVLTAILLSVYIVLLYMKGRGIGASRAGRSGAAAALILVAAAEVCSNTVYALNMNGTVTRSAYLQYADDMAQYRSEFEPDEDSFYRMEIAQIQGRDDVTRYHLNGMGFFSSTCDDHMEHLMRDLGFFMSGNKYSYNGATPLTDALEGIRYVASNTELTWPDLTFVKKIGQEYIYQNDTALSVGFLVDDSIRNWSIIEGMPFSVQNDFAMQALGTQRHIFDIDAFQINTPTAEGGTVSPLDDDTWDFMKDEAEGSVTFQLTFTDTAKDYIYFSAPNCENMVLSVDGKETTYTDEKGHIVYLGECGPDSNVTVRFQMDSEHTTGNITLQTASLNEDAFAEVYDGLSASQLEITHASSAELSGTINADRDGVMLLSVPYDEGWTIRIDGEKAEPFRIGEGFTGVEMSAGEHSVQLTYMPQGFIPGVICSLGSVFLLGLYLRKMRRSGS